MIISDFCGNSEAPTWIMRYITTHQIFALTDLFANSGEPMQFHHAKVGLFEIAIVFQHDS